MRDTCDGHAARQKVMQEFLKRVHITDALVVRAPEEARHFGMEARFTRQAMSGVYGV